MSLRKYTTPKEFAETYKISIPHAYKVFKRLPKGILVRIGRSIRADEEGLKEWLAAGGELQ